MDLLPILDAALLATGTDPTAKEIEADALERAQKALRFVDQHIDKILGHTEVAEITLTVDQQT